MLLRRLCAHTACRATAVLSSAAFATRSGVRPICKPAQLSDHDSNKSSVCITAVARQCQLDLGFAERSSRSVTEAVRSVCALSALHAPVRAHSCVSPTDGHVSSTFHTIRMLSDCLPDQDARGAVSVSSLCKHFVNGGSCPRGEACV